MAKQSTEVTVWEGGLGNIVLRTVARNEAEAINNLCDKEPLLLAIGCSVAPMANIDGCRIVAIVDDKFEFGDDRRKREDDEYLEKLKAEALELALEEERINQARIAEAERLESERLATEAEATELAAVPPVENTID